MKTYISLLRGINVSGKKLIKMDALKAMYENLGFFGVHTYLQSGNVVFSTDEDRLQQLQRMISSQISCEFGFEVAVVVLAKEALKEIVIQNPFTEEASRNSSSVYVTVLFDQPGSYDETSIKDKQNNGEQIEIDSRTAYLYCPTGYGRTKLNNNFLERKLKVEATTRNWKTISELLNLANASKD